eukprot:gnl/MRDRNA2_/MRDRNA2_109110_c0_seq1.p1 gnl/MRDRNA2_/MRDRNA2_109110_c0~~gnl/MRDRNA2_/MRDRNA2_109110_c0_seq1.p1  ORF type:complete len:322 (+),score=49.44 gnl/MRDRNA2_/MRDRNA2_109110_c0_seq1:67-1032(+)
MVFFLDHFVHSRDLDLHHLLHSQCHAPNFSESDGHALHTTAFLSQAINTISMPKNKVMQEHALQSVQFARSMMQELENKIEVLQVAVTSLAQKMALCQQPQPGDPPDLPVCEPKAVRRALDLVAWEKARVESARAQVLNTVKAALGQVQGVGGASCGSSSHTSSKNPATWGPQAWQFLHCAAQNLPDEVPLDGQQSFEAMVQSLPQLLPCASCGNNLRRHLMEEPIHPYLGTRNSVQRWLVRLHNKVNAELGKPILPEGQALDLAAQSCAPKAANVHASFPATAQASCEGLLLTGLILPSQPCIKQSTEQCKWSAFFPNAS